MRILSYIFSVVDPGSLSVSLSASSFFLIETISFIFNAVYAYISLEFMSCWKEKISEKICVWYIYESAISKEQTPSWDTDTTREIVYVW